MKAFFDSGAKFGEACLTIQAETVTEVIALQFWMNQPDMPQEYKHMLIILDPEQEPLQE